LLVQGEMPTVRSARPTLGSRDEDCVTTGWAHVK
jgi:hypothetical protein